jgi:protease PrsW
MECLFCTQQVPTGAAFCGHCGKPLAVPSAPSVTDTSADPTRPSARAAAARESSARGLFDKVSEHVSSVTGVDRVEGFDAKEMFSSVLEKRTEEDIEEYFLVGTPSTTPPLAAINATWPKPWVFFKVFAFSLIVYLGFVYAWSQFRNEYLLPGLIIVGSFAVPISVVIFYFEMNVPRNVSMYQVVKLLILGGILSLIVSLFGFSLLGLSWLGASRAGIVEETGKLLALLLVIDNQRYRWTLNGLLLGGAVGAGFAAFESAGYAMSALLNTNSDAAMFENIVLRGFLAPGAHVAWTALVGAALWKLKGTDKFSFAMLTDDRFLRVFGLAVGLHMVWNAPIQLPFLIIPIALSVIAWVAILSFVQDGLKQVQREQAAVLATPAASV